MLLTLAVLSMKFRQAIVLGLFCWYNYLKPAVESISQHLASQDNISIMSWFHVLLLYFYYFIIIIITNTFGCHYDYYYYNNDLLPS